MKNSVKKIFAAIAATAMCAVPMTSAMSASAALDNAVKYSRTQTAQELQLSDVLEMHEITEAKLADSVRVSTALKKGGNIADIKSYSGRLTQGTRVQEFKLRQFWEKGGHWEIIFVGGRIIIIWVPDPPRINPEAHEVLEGKYYKGIYDVVGDKRASVVVTDAIRNVGVREAKADTIDIVNLGNNKAYSATKIEAQDILMRTGNINARTAQMLVTK